MLNTSPDNSPQPPQPDRHDFRLPSDFPTQNLKWGYWQEVRKSHTAGLEIEHDPPCKVIQNNVVSCSGVQGVLRLPLRVDYALIPTTDGLMPGCRIMTGITRDESGLPDMSEEAIITLDKALKKVNTYGMYRAIREWELEYAEIALMRPKFDGYHCRHSIMTHDPFTGRSAEALHHRVFIVAMEGPYFNLWHLGPSDADYTLHPVAELQGGTVETIPKFLLRANYRNGTGVNPAVHERLLSMDEAGDVLLGHFRTFVKSITPESK